MQREQGYDGPAGTTAQEEMPTNNKAPYSLRETEGGITYRDARETNAARVTVRNDVSGYKKAHWKNFSFGPQ